MPPRPRILVVEDDPAVQRTLCATLHLQGFTPHQTGTIDEALVILGTAPVDAISLDIRLPDRSGRQRTGLSLLTRLRATAEYAQVPVVIFTGMPLSPGDEALVHRHHAALFYKPLPYARVIACLRESLAVPPVQ